MKTELTIICKLDHVHGWDVKLVRFQLWTFAWAFFYLLPSSGIRAEFAPQRHRQ